MADEPAAPAPGGGGRRAAGIALLVAGNAILLWLAWDGLRGALRQFPQATTELQQIQTLIQGLFGLLALALLATPMLPRRLLLSVQTGWLLSVSLATGLAAIGWGEAPLWAALVTALAGLGIAWLPLVLLRIGRRLIGSG